MDYQKRASSVWATAVCILLGALCMLVTFVTVAGGQALKGTFVGTVKDTQGAVLPNAQITVTNSGTNVRITSSSNGSGDYNVPFLDSGTCIITAEAYGFKKVVQTVNLDVAAKVRVDFNLPPGSSTEVVDVASSTPLVETDTSNLGEVVPEERLHQLP